MKKYIVPLIVSLFLMSPIHTVAENEELSTECKKMLEETKSEYISLVNNDVLASFNLLDKSIETAIYFTASDLWKNEFLIGKNDTFNSLKKLMAGKYRGEKRLYFFNQDPSIGYILYKDLNNNNVMLTISKVENKWIVTEENKKEGRDITIEATKCDDQHFMQKMFDNLYP